MTAAEFNAQVRHWADEVKAMASASLAAGTHGTGRLRERFEAFVDTGTHLTSSYKDDGVDVAYKVKFGFDRYGVFRAYGVGRGWVRVGGVLTRGYRVRSYQEIENKIWTGEARRLLKKGMAKQELNSLKRIIKEDGRVDVRTPLDWLDQHINHRINELADHVQEYYGDAAMRTLLEEFGKVRIVKKGNNISIQ